MRSSDGATVGVCVDGAVVAERVAVPTGSHSSNLAVAVAVALALGVDREDIGGRLATLPSVDHRLQAARSESGVSILDDTYNANPAGAAEALEALVAQAPGAPGPDGLTGRPPRRVVVTPGMVELGSRQYEENKRFGAVVAAVADDLIVVGRTNRRALVAGAVSDPGAGVTVTLVDHRDHAVSWVRQHLGPGDAVLYENDLPDHYP
jgi:UDP-N-acetylmuramoyl-tripeptide--D-alanyl-D-alanine ligase